MVELILFDAFGKEIVEPNTPGELYVGTKSMFKEYHKARDGFETDHRGDYHTVGGIAYRDEEDFFFICDRYKDVIISGGMNVYPTEIGSALENHEKILEAAVFGIPSEEWGEMVHATVVPIAEATLAETEVTAFPRPHRAGYKIPRSISFLDELPRTGSGIVPKRVLRESDWNDHESRL